MNEDELNGKSIGLVTSYSGAGTGVFAGPTPIYILSTSSATVPNTLLPSHRNSHRLNK